MEPPNARMGFAPDRQRCAWRVPARRHDPARRSGRPRGFRGVPASRSAMAGMARCRELPVAQPVLRDRLRRGICFLAVSEVVAYSYGLRQDSLVTAAEQSNADHIRRLTADVKS